MILKVVLYDVQGFSYWFTFSLSKIGSLEDEIMIVSLFLGLSLILHPLPVLAATHPLTPYRSSSLLESPFRLSVALKLVFSFLHWQKWERVAGLCGKWEEHRGWNVLKSCGTSLFSPKSFCFIPIEAFAV